MEFDCPNCGNSSFEILRRRVGGATHAKCLKCGKETLFSAGKQPLQPGRTGPEAQHPGQIGNDPTPDEHDGEPHELPEGLTNPTGPR